MYLLQDKRVQGKSPSLDIRMENWEFYSKDFVTNNKVTKVRSGETQVIR